VPSASKNHKRVNTFSLAGTGSLGWRFGALARQARRPLSLHQSCLVHPRTYISAQQHAEPAPSFISRCTKPSSRINLDRSITSSAVFPSTSVSRTFKTFLKSFMAPGQYMGKNNFTITALVATASPMHLSTSMRNASILLSSKAWPLSLK